MHEVDPSGGFEDPLDDVAQVLSSSVRVTGVEAETDLEIREVLP